MSTITVYGATGMVGSEIVTEAVARGYQVTGVTHGNPDHVKNPVAGVSYVSGDIADTGDVVEKAKATDIIVFSVPGARDGSSVQPIIDAHSRSTSWTPRRTAAPASSCPTPDRRPPIPGHI
jgi:putative NADH-flavin reductase